MVDVKSEKFKTLRLESWHDFENYDPKSPQVVFRGQSDKEWPLESAYLRYHQKRNPVPELGILRSFVSQAAVYTRDIPDSEDDYVSWLSLMQHYGTATRMLDVTRSQYVALFFAVMGMMGRNEKADGAVWVMKTFASDLAFYNAVMTSLECPCLDTRRAPDVQALEEHKGLGWRFANQFIVADALQDFYEVEDDVVRPHVCRMRPFLDSGGVVHVVPRKMNKRQTAQAAEFLVPITLRKTFEDNLFSASVEDGRRVVPETVKIEIPYELIGVCLKKLEEMNITYQTLFPDLTGLARRVNDSW